MIDSKLLAAYRFFHECGTMRVGSHGVDALAMARAEAWVKERDDLEIVVEPEQDRYFVGAAST